MIEVAFDGATPGAFGIEEDLATEWEKLLSVGRKHAAQVVSKYEATGRADFSSCKTTWRAMASWLQKYVFAGKCAYCERLMEEPAQADHYRPKKEVTDPEFREKGGRFECRRNPKSLVELPNGDRQEHPGYFWLVCHWANIVPVCGICNTTKGAKFPVLRRHSLVERLATKTALGSRSDCMAAGTPDGCCYCYPQDLNLLEEPALLNPYFDNPREFIDFANPYRPKPRESIRPEARERAINTIATVGLDREVLGDARNTARSTFWGHLLSHVLVLSEVQQIDGQELREEAVRMVWRASSLAKVLSGESRYSSTMLAWVAEHYKEYAGIMTMSFGVSEDDVWNGTPSTITKWVRPDQRHGA